MVGRGTGCAGEEVNQVYVLVLGCCDDKCVCICFVSESIVLLFKMCCGSLFQSLMVRESMSACMRLC